MLWNCPADGMHQCNVLGCQGSGKNVGNIHTNASNFRGSNFCQLLSRIPPKQWLWRQIVEQHLISISFCMHYYYRKRTLSNINEICVIFSMNKAFAIKLNQRIYRAKSKKKSLTCSVLSVLCSYFPWHDILTDVPFLAPMSGPHFRHICSFIVWKLSASVVVRH